MSLKLCKFFIENKSCKFGKHCRFLHQNQRPPPTFSGSRYKNESHHENSVTIVDSEHLSVSHLPIQRQAREVDLKSQNYENDESETSAPLQHDTPVKEEVLEFTESSNTSSSSRSSKQAAKSSKGLCVHFARGGKCYYGKNCRFSHALPKGSYPNYQSRNTKKANVPPRFRSNESNIQSEQLDHMKNVSVNSEEKNYFSEQDHQMTKIVQQKGKSKSNTEQKPPKTKKICLYYKSNNCHRGERCRFQHPSDIFNDVSGENVSKQSPSQMVLIKNDEGKITKLYPKAGAQPRTQQAMPVGPSGLKPILTYKELEEVDVDSLRNWEISIIQKRFPKDKITIIADEQTFSARILVTPTDPDWPFDVDVFELLVTVPENYPRQMLQVSLPKDQNLPETVRRYIEITIGEWFAEEKKKTESMQKVQLIFRPFLKWFDRNLEDITTEALKQFKRELVARAAGIEILSPQQLAERLRTNSQSSDDDAESNKSDNDYNEGSTDDSEAETSEDDHSEDEEATVNNLYKSLSTDPNKKGTEIELRNLQLKENASSLLFERLKLIIQCGRCKNHSDLTVHQGKVMSMRCEKCNQNQYVNYRAALMHQFSSILGYLDVDGCQAFDLILQDCSVFVTCMGCSKQTKTEGLVSGQMIDGWCQACNARFKLAIQSVKFSQLAPSGVDTSVSKVVEVTSAKSRKPPKDPAIREGFPLPEFGTCKHYKHSYRWLRFPCCGKAYPCDVCHDKKEDHEMTFANRMICGHCCKEQNFSASRPCSACNQHMTKIRSAHWEGGSGCRDKIAMSNKDAQKHKNQNKTVSNHKKKVSSGGSSKKNTKLRHS